MSWEDNEYERRAAAAAFAEFLRHREKGKEPDLEDFCIAYTERADALRDLHALYLRLQKSGENLGFEAPAGEQSVDAEKLRQLYRLHAEEGREQEDPGETTLAFEKEDLGRPGLRPLAGSQAPTEAADLSRIVEDDLVGALLGGRYRIDRKLGEGGFGTVYAATHVVLGARVAVKVLNPRAAREEHALDDFLREARLLTSVDHENIVRWITFDRTKDGLHYFVMEYLEGQELSEILDDEGGKLPWKRAARILLQVLAALRTAHDLPGDQSLLHLDLKPQNVFVVRGVGSEPEKAKVIDFGIGQHIGAEARALSYGAVDAVSDLSETDLEKSIATAATPKKLSRRDATPVKRARGGTLLYASPEQCAHLAGHEEIVPLDGRSDLYSLGVMAFHMLTGVYPFDRYDTFARAIENHIKVPPRKLSSMGVKVPTRLAKFVDQCLLKDREKRWASTDQAYETLERVVNPPQRVTKALVLLLLIAVMAAWGVSRLFDHSPVPILGLINKATNGVVETLHLAEGQKVSLRVADRTLLEPAAELRLTDTGSGGRPEAGWTLVWTNRTEGELYLAVSTTQPPAPGAAPVRIEFLRGGDMTARSEDFTVYYIPPWKVAKVDVEGYDHERLLDPLDRKLRVVLTGLRAAREAVEQVVLRHGPTTLERFFPPLEHSEDESQCSLSLSKLAGDDGLIELTVEVTDLAGRSTPETVPLSLASSRVRFEEATFGIREGQDGDFSFTPAQTWGGTYLLVYDPRCEVRVVLSREADLRFRIIFESGAEVPAASEELKSVKRASKIHHLSLNDLDIFKNTPRFDGRLVLEADDSGTVDRLDDTRSRTSREISIHFDPRPPQLEVLLGGQPLKPEGINYTKHTGPLTVRTTDPDRRLYIRASSRTEGDDGGVTSLDGELNAPSTTRPTVTLDHHFEDEGRYRVSVSSFQLLAPGKAGARLSPELAFEILVDRRPPKLSFNPENIGLVKNGDRPDATLTIEDPSPLRSVRYELKPPAESVPLPSLPSRDGSRDGKTSRQIRLWPELWSADKYAKADGKYRLTAIAEDAAGNSSSASCDWEIAFRRPTVDLDEPRQVPGDPVGEFRWAVDERWNISVRVRDPNGVGTVTARIEKLDGAHEPLEFALVRHKGDLWHDPQPKPVSFKWSKSLVSITVTAIDPGNNESTARKVARLPVIEPRYPEWIARRSAPDVRMRLVRGNVDSPYVAGGRGTAKEKTPAGFRRRLADWEHWGLEIGAGEVRSYYLDEAEVSRGQYLRFLRADGGYRESSWWPPGAAGPSRERWQALQSELEERPIDPNLPVTGVSWEEAFAYARWVGKRLPTLLQWEYAVRGGSEYRFHPLGSQPQTELNERELNVGGSRAARAWRSGEGDDRTLEGIQNLASNVQEWTCTPDRFAGCAPGTSIEACYRENLEWFKSPDRPGSGYDRQKKYWVTGGSYATGEYCFFERALFWRTEPKPDVGFRCALDAAEALDRLLGSPAERLELIEKKRESRTRDVR